MNSMIYQTNLIIIGRNILFVRIRIIIIRKNIMRNFFLSIFKHNISCLMESLSILILFISVLKLIIFLLIETISCCKLLIEFFLDFFLSSHPKVFYKTNFGFNKNFMFLINYGFFFFFENLFFELKINIWLIKIKKYYFS